MQQKVNCKMAFLTCNFMVFFHYIVAVKCFMCDFLTLSVAAISALFKLVQTSNFRERNRKTRYEKAVINFCIRLIVKNSFQLIVQAFYFFTQEFSGFIGSLCAARYTHISLLFNKLLQPVTL